MPEHPAPPPPPGSGGKAAEGLMIEWIKDVVTGFYTDAEKERAIESAYK